MFKSCDYCRHRKRKCVVPPASTRCSDCEHLDLPCEFSVRHPSLKRRQTSKQIAARVTTAYSKPPKTKFDTESSKNVVDEANLKEGDCQLRLAGRRDMANKRLFQLRNSCASQRGSPLSLAEQYWRDVHLFWPFVSSEMLEENALQEEPIFRSCVEVACLLSLNSMEELEDRSLHTERLESILQLDQLNTTVIAGTLLLVCFFQTDDGMVQKMFENIDRKLADPLVCIPPAVVSGALLTNVWRRLSGHTHQPLHLSADILQNYAQELDPTTFGHHFLRLSRHAVELDQRCMAMDLEGMQPDTPRIWSRLEYECLLWQVCLHPTLLDTRDDLPATPESVVIHCYSSMVLLSFYSYVLRHADTLGASIALRPVPGVLLFLCALARSTFICPRRLLNRMSLLVSMQAQTARIMLELWHQTKFENCRAILNLWEDPGNRFPDLAREVREEIGQGPWAIEEIDGYSVFWTFRDLRTLTTKFIFSDRAQ